MSAKNRFRENMVTPSGSIPYGDSICSDGCVYSLDKFRPRFRLCWGNLVLRRLGMELDLSDQTVIEFIRDQVVFPLVDHSISGYVPRIPIILYSWNYDGYIVFIEKFTMKQYPQPFYSLICEFNPNKSQDDFLFISALISRLKALLGDYFIWDDTRTDFTFDVPYPISDVRILSRKAPSSYMGTFFFGKRGASGYTRIYDKLLEMKQKHHTDIGADWTRIEYESHSGYPVNYDPPFLLGDLGTHEVLRYVPMDSWPAALRTFAPKTARRIKRDGLRRIPFDPSQFDILYQRLLDRLELPAPYNVEYRNREEVEGEMYELERISAELRRFAKDID